MKIQKSTILINKFQEEIDNKVEKEIHALIDNIKKAIKEINHPDTSDVFKINPMPKKLANNKLDKHPNGVQYIKYAFSQNLLEKGDWAPETKQTNYKNYDPDLSIDGWGPVDFSYQLKTPIDISHLPQKTLDGKMNGLFLIEWETGNVSSSHRSINKIISTIFFSNVVGGVLIVPTAELKPYITDRVGNYEELEPYFHLWKIQQESSRIKRGYLEIIGVTYDELDNNVDYLPKGKDGNAYRFRG